MDRDQEIPFVYEGGMLRPEGRVDLPEGARGIARIREIASPLQGANQRRSALEAIHKVAESRVFDSGGTRLSRDQMHERD